MTDICNGCVNASNCKMIDNVKRMKVQKCILRKVEKPALKIIDWDDSKDQKVSFVAETEDTLIMNGKEFKKCKCGKNWAILPVQYKEFVPNAVTGIPEEVLKKEVMMCIPCATCLHDMRESLNVMHKFIGSEKRYKNRVI